MANLSQLIWLLQGKRISLYLVTVAENWGTATVTVRTQEAYLRMSNNLFHL